MLIKSNSYLGYNANYFYKSVLGYDKKIINMSIHFNDIFCCQFMNNPRHFLDPSQSLMNLL